MRGEHLRLRVHAARMLLFARLPRPPRTFVCTKNAPVHTGHVEMHKAKYLLGLFWAYSPLCSVCSWKRTYTAARTMQPNVKRRKELVCDRYEEAVYNCITSVTEARCRGVIDAKALGDFFLTDTGLVEFL